MTPPNPTPEQIANDPSLIRLVAVDPGTINATRALARIDLLADLERAGYRIVHPDDVPSGTSVYGDHINDSSMAYGWDRCRAHIFGEDE